MKHLNKLLAKIDATPQLFKQPDINFIVGLTNTQIKELKKEALAQGLIKETKREYYLTDDGKEYLHKNPVMSWCSSEFPKRPEINLEYLKLEKAPPTLTRAIRLLAKHLLEGEVSPLASAIVNSDVFPTAESNSCGSCSLPAPSLTATALKENSTEYYLIKELLCSNSTCKAIEGEIETDILQDGKQKLTSLFEKFTSAPYGLTKSIIGVLLLDVLNKNKDILAIYENGQFQLKLNQLMFDRMLYCPERFEVQKTVLENMPILEKISEVILPIKSNNILDLTKGLIHFIRNLDKYTLNTEQLSKKTTRFRNTIMNAKDPINLFYRDIPKILDDKILCQCKISEDGFLKAFETAINELQTATTKMINNLYIFALSAFNSKNREELTQRFEAIKEYIGDSELKILYNNVVEKNSEDKLWIERIATFINKSRVPKDWSDSDVADFKVKVKELALKFLAIESTAGDSTCEERLDETFNKLLTSVLQLSKAEKNILLRRIINE